jgi:hypothetical protein
VSQSDGSGSKAAEESWGPVLKEREGVKEHSWSLLIPCIVNRLHKHCVTFMDRLGLAHIMRSDSQHFRMPTKSPCCPKSAVTTTREIIFNDTEPTSPLPSIYLPPDHFHSSCFVYESWSDARFIAVTDNDAISIPPRLAPRWAQTRCSSVRGEGCEYRCR